MLILLGLARLSLINVFHKQLEEPVFQEHRNDLKNHHMLLRKKFNLCENPSNAFIDISADDYYKLYINRLLTNLET